MIVNQKISNNILINVIINIINKNLKHQVNTKFFQSTIEFSVLHKFGIGAGAEDKSFRQEKISNAVSLKFSILSPHILSFTPQPLTI